MRNFDHPAAGDRYARFSPDFEESPAAPSAKIPAKIYGVMALTTVLTFASLVTGYQLLFPPQQLFA